MKRLFAALAGAWFCCAPLAAAAHPLGNFTINHLTETRFTQHAVHVRYVLDMAEIPAYQTMREISPSGKLDQHQLKQWALLNGAQSIAHVVFTVDEKPVRLHIEHAEARTRPGAGGLPTLYLVADSQAELPLAHGARRFHLEDQTYTGRLGWHDAIVIPETEPTKELTAYPNALLGSPREITSVGGTLSANGTAVVSSQSDTAAVTSISNAPTTGAESFARSNQLSDMIARGTSDWSFVALTLLVAIVLGALHALEPGHGKTLLAISLVGARATVKQATILACALTVAHTIGVLALGLALNLFKGYFVPENIYPWITLVSGIVIAIIGARAIARELRKRNVVHAHGHTHAHAHPHDHVHDHGTDQHHHHDDMDDAEHALLHAIPGTAPMRFGPTVWAAMSGGIAPCPAALVVLLAAIALNQVAYGMFVIIAFSAGLAATLTTLGIAVVRGANWLQGRPQFDRFVKFGPLVSSCVISLIGAVMVGQGFAEQGVAAPAIVISAIVLLVIAGYAFSHPTGHRHVELG